MAQRERSAGGAQRAFLLVAWPLALVVAAVQPRPWSLHTKLTLLGAALEVGGIGLLASDFLGPAFASAWRRGREAARRLAEAIRQLYRPTHRVSAVAGMPYESGQARIVTAVNFREGTVDEVQRELIRLASHVDEVETRLSARMGEIRADLERNRAQLRAAISEAIEQSKGEFFALRAFGFLVALAGSVLLALANFF